MSYSAVPSHLLAAGVFLWIHPAGMAVLLAIRARTPPPPDLATRSALCSLPLLARAIAGRFSPAAPGGAGWPLVPLVFLRRSIDLRSRDAR